MSTINKRLSLLREQMKKCGVSASIIPTSDPHLSEYIQDCFKFREYFSGFNGSAGTLLVTLSKAYIFTDGRYFLQAEKQLENTEIKLVRSGVSGEPTITELCHNELNSGQSVFIDSRFISYNSYKKQSSELSEFGITLSSNADPVFESASLPIQRFSEIRELDRSLCGLSRLEKIDNVRKKIKETNAEGLILTELDDIAWLFNLRGDDIENTPVFYSFAYVTLNEAYLFVGANAANNILPSLINDGIKVLNYDKFTEFISVISEKIIIADKNTVNAQIINALPDSARFASVGNPVHTAKAVKNKTEIDNMKRAHLYDGVALVKFMRLIKSAASGSYTEISAAKMLLDLRRESENFVSNSFDTISAYNENAAIIHYSPSLETDKIIESKGALLVDSGGQYNGGTTDVTRVFVLGETTPEFKRDYTLVCKAMLKLQNIHFPIGIKSAVLDGVVREPLWKYGVDFRHGTGHGIGYMLSVHEGPTRISFKDTSTEIVPGMITSDEPGIYVDGKYGIRLENALLCVADKDTEYGKFCKFEPLTLCPIDLDALDFSLLTHEDVENINEYHKTVYERLFPYLSKSDADYLKSVTREI